MTKEADVARVIERAEKVAHSLSDGFHLYDLAVLVKAAIETAETLDSYTGQGKRELAVHFVKEVLRLTDGPGPDVLLDPILECVVPCIIDLVVDATKGKIGINNA